MAYRYWIRFIWDHFRNCGSIIYHCAGFGHAKWCFFGSVNKPDYLTVVSAHENKVLIGVLFQLTLTASVVAIPIIMFPILKETNESLALMYVGARIFEGIADAVIAISPLLLLTLSREFVKAGTPTAKTDINEIK